MRNLVEVSKNYIPENNTEFGFLGAIITLGASLLGLMGSAVSAVLPTIISLIGFASKKGVDIATKVAKISEPYLKYKSYEQKLEAQQQARDAAKRINDLNYKNTQDANIDTLSHTLAKFLEIWCYRTYPESEIKLLNDYANGIVSKTKMAEVCGDVYNSVAKTTKGLPALEILDFIMFEGISELYNQNGLSKLTTENIDKIVNDFLEKTQNKYKFNSTDKYVDLNVPYSDSDKQSLKDIVYEFKNNNTNNNQINNGSSSTDNNFEPVRFDPDLINWDNLTDKNIVEMFENNQLSEKDILNSKNRDKILNILRYIRVPYTSIDLKNLIQKSIFENAGANTNG